jgi:hypothetical protein
VEPDERLFPPLRRAGEEADGISAALQSTGISNRRFALLAEATEGALGACREFLMSELLAAGQDVVQPDTVALRPDLRQRKR